MRRTGLGRRHTIEHAAGDPLDGLVNLFDLGIVLAVAFLVAGLGLTLDTRAHQLRPRAWTGRSEVVAPGPRVPRTGRGQPVGTVYRLADGSLVLVNTSEARTALAK